MLGANGRNLAKELQQLMAAPAAREIASTFSCGTERKSISHLFRLWLLGEKAGMSLDSLSLEKRSEVYRNLAEQALRAAAGTYDPGVRASLLTSAASWQKLAAETEKAMERLKAPTERPEEQKGEQREL